jgi:hypothetical protein
MSDSITGSDWTEREIDLIIEDYFAMFDMEVAGIPFNKAERNRTLQVRTGRVRGAIERKHQNISAVLDRLGLRWISGYKPLSNFQDALIDGIARYLSTSGRLLIEPAQTVTPRVADASSLWVGPPPTPLPDHGQETEALNRLVRKYDPAERDARNRALGKEGEALVLEHERVRLIGGGRNDLANKIEWTSQVRGDGAGYDIRSFALSGAERLIEVKTTNGSAHTPFFLSENERAFSDERPDAFRLMRVYGFARRPAAFEVAPPLDRLLKLSPTNYRAAIA